MRIDGVDPSSPPLARVQATTGSITQVNTIMVPGELMEQALAVWRAYVAYLKTRPGFVSTQLFRRGAGENQILVDIAVWESTQALAAARSAPEYEAVIGEYPEGVVVHSHISDDVIAAE